MTKSRLPIFNLSENYWSEIHRIADMPITSAIVQYKGMRFIENNEISYFEGSFIGTENIKRISVTK